MISNNPLFAEAISEALASNLGSPVISVTPEQALERLRSEPAEALLIDDAIPPGMLRQIIKRIKQPVQPRLILLNCIGNDLIILDCRQVTIGSVIDLVNSIQSKEPASAEIQPFSPERG